MESVTVAEQTHPTAVDPGDRAPDHADLAVARALVGEVFGPLESRTFTVRYWTAAEEAPPSGVRSTFTLTLRDPGALRRMFLPPGEVSLAESFVRSDFDIVGDLESAAALAPLAASRLRSTGAIGRVLRLLLRLPKEHTSRAEPHPYRPPLRLLGRRHARDRDTVAVRWHYDVGNDFYALWLDRERVYSCGYFPTGNESLDEAQRGKLELICRKLRLRPGETLLDIGCGWGGLVRHAVRHYGVTALGVTLSPSQAALARDRLESEGLGDRCAVQVADYRDIPLTRTFDKIASVGMFEHVGARQLGTYFATAYRLLRPGGLFLNHGIVALEQARKRSVGKRISDLVWRRGKFSQRYVFPDGELLPLGAVTSQAEAVGLEARDVESLREHYALTLRHWVRRLEARAAEAIAIVGEERYRVWRLYMAGAARSFATGRLGVVQMLLAKANASGRVELPGSRADLFER